jgi:hypothetical protein
LRKLGIGAVLALATALAGCLGHVTLPADVAPARLPVQAAERIPINLRTSWPALLAAVENEIPRCQATDADGACPETAGDGAFVFRKEGEWMPIDQRMLGQPMGIQVAAWRRDPLTATIAGNHVKASLGLLYRVRIGLMSGRQLGSCGYGEAPRELNVKLDGDLRLAPQWYVDPEFRVTLDPGIRCTVSFLQIDVTDRVVDAVREALAKEAEDARQRIREITNVRDMAADVWSRVDQPMAIGNGAWFLPNLSDAHVRLPQVSPDGRYLGMTVAVEGVPKVVIGARPVVVPAPLPTLTVGEIDPEFGVKVRGLIAYDQASAIIASHLADLLKRDNLSGVRLSRVTVSGRGRNVLVAMEVRGPVTGTFYLFGVPRFEGAQGGMASGRLTLDHPGFSFETQSAFSRLVVTLLRNRIEGDVKAAAWWDATPELQKAFADLGGALNRPLTPQARLEGRLSEFGPGEVRVGAEGLEAWYRIAGKLAVVVTPFN